MSKGNMKMFKLIFCIVISCVGVYMTFFHQKEPAALNHEKKAEEVKEKAGDRGMADKLFQNSTEILPDTENESSDTYTERNTVNLYFSNTEKLDNGKLPIAAQKELAEDAQKFLDEAGYSDVTELYIEDSSYQETAEWIQFDCYMDGYQDMLRIEYRFDAESLFFAVIVNSDQNTEMSETKL